MRRFRAVLWAPALLLLAAPAPVGAERWDTTLEKWIGPLVSQSLVGMSGTEEDPLLTRWVRGIGERLAAQSPRDDLSPRFVILASDVANALTLPGGTVLVTRGLLDSVRSDDELAGVLAHETAHVAKRHALQQIGGTLAVSSLLGLLRGQRRESAVALSVLASLRSLARSRQMEAQADEEGIGIAAAAGYDPAGLVQFLQGLAGGSRGGWEEYFQTHPAPQKRLEAARRNPLLARSAPAVREAVAAGYAARGLPGSARRVRRGEDPLPLPAPPAPHRDPSLAEERADVVQRCAKGLRSLNETYRAQRVGGALQPLLLMNSPGVDLRWLYLAGRAYGVQARAMDVYARSVRVWREAPRLWDELASAGRQDAESAVGRGEARQAALRAEQAPEPLGRASKAAAAALLDLNNRFYRPGREASWLRFAAVEGLLRFAESELARADRASAEAWRLLSVARIRYLVGQIDALAPEGDAERRALWEDLARRRLGEGLEPRGPAGTASARAALALELGESPAAAERGRAEPWADWIVRKGGVPEHIAAALRLLALDLEREQADRNKESNGTANDG